MSPSSSDSDLDLPWTTPINDTPPRRGARAWVIVALVVATLAIIGAALFYFSGPDRETPVPDASDTPTVQPTETDAPEPSGSPSPGETTPEREETEDDPSQPPYVDPDLEKFAAEVTPFLDDAQRGLSIAENSEPDEAVHVVATLQEDVLRLQERIAPGAITDDWPVALDRYAASLNALQQAYASGENPDSVLAEARDAAAAVSALVNP